MSDEDFAILFFGMKVYAFVFVLLTTLGFKIIWSKYEMSTAIRRYASKKKWFLLHELSLCEFCINHHIAVICTVIFAYIELPELWHIFLPLMISATLNQLKRPI